MGDVTLYSGYVADLLKEVEMVLYDGTAINTSRDLCWALRGGDGGNGVVTPLNLKIVESPQPLPKETHIQSSLELMCPVLMERMFRSTNYLHESHGKVLNLEEIRVLLMEKESGVYL